MTMKMTELFVTFKANRKLTYDILEALSEEEIRREWSRPGLDTYAKHFEEMALVLIAYTDALKTGTMDFGKVPDVFEFQEVYTRQELRDKLKSSEEYLEETLKQNVYRDEVFWFDMNLPAEIHFVNIISHEVLHQGMMIMDMYQHNIQLPESLVESWSLPQVE